MFNLPFPTDSLYKFCFMFGLVLVVFSFYFRDGHLNRYDKKQSHYILDSLRRSLDKATDDLKVDVNAISQFKKFLVEKQDRYPSLGIPYRQHDMVYLKEVLKREKDSQSVTNIDGILNELTTEKEGNVARFSNNLSKLEFFIHKENTERTNILRDKIVFLISKLAEDNFYYYILLATGGFLFISGALAWYYKIQKLQDKLLKIQLLEAEQKVHHTKPVLGRKHKEPINIKGKKTLK